ncbi:MAG: hypothetical protein ACNA78_12040, partial [Balneolaceae bacterium]
MIRFVSIISGTEDNFSRSLPQVTEAGILNGKLLENGRAGIYINPTTADAIGGNIVSIVKGGHLIQCNVPFVIGPAHHYA